MPIRWPEHCVPLNSFHKNRPSRGRLARAVSLAGCGPPHFHGPSCTAMLLVHQSNCSPKRTSQSPLFLVSPDERAGLHASGVNHDHRFPSLNLPAIRCWTKLQRPLHCGRMAGLGIERPSRNPVLIGLLEIEAPEEADFTRRISNDGSDSKPP